MAKARKSRAKSTAAEGSAWPRMQRNTRATLARVAASRVISNHRPTEDALLPEGVPDTYEKLYDRGLLHARH